MSKKIVLIGLAFAVIVASTYFFRIPATPATAAPVFESETYFYANPDFTNEVGYRHVTCNSGIYTQGSPSPNMVRYYGQYCSSGSAIECIRCLQEQGQVDCPVYLEQLYGVSECQF